MSLVFYYFFMTHKELQTEQPLLKNVHAQPLGASVHVACTTSPLLTCWRIIIIA
jgi:hypothetical protein